MFIGVETLFVVLVLLTTGIDVYLISGEFMSKGSSPE